ncbi:hypothetical protein ABNQ39_00090 (plasmid) [Azospirillum sp. A26]|uniref:hypothetical protein n=1 Tax=Azospirillum sp. A26 TaxID=3160607 RepID=UPI00366EC2A8
MEFNHDTIKACASSGAPGNAQMHQKMQAIASRAGQDVCVKAEPPLLVELYERLSHTRQGLRAGVDRIDAFNDRVLGGKPTPSVGNNTGSGPASSSDALRDLVNEIAMLTEELLGCASRIERIG